MTVTEDQLYVQPKDPGFLDGTGPAAAVRDLAGSRSSVEAAPNAVSAGLSALGFIQDPFQGLLAGCYGWVIEQVSFLREPLDQLAGNPRAIEAHAGTWQKISQQLNTSAQQRRDDVSGIANWRGEARDRYYAASMKQAEGLQGAAGRADQLSQQVLQAGALVGAVRSLIRDLITKFLAMVTERLVLAAAAAPETLGGSIAALAADVAVEGTQLLATITAKIAQLVKVLSGSSTAMSALARDVEASAKELADVAANARTGLPVTWNTVRDAVGEAIKGSGEATLGKLTEVNKYWAQKAGVQAWKQEGKATETESEWNA